MATKAKVSAREGWFTLDENNPRLLGSQCQQCHTWYFPAHDTYCRNPACESEEFDVRELSNRGKIWSYTNAAYAPPAPFIAHDPYEIFSVAAVELEHEKLVVMGQLVRGVTVEDVSIGDEVELVLDTLFEDDDNEYLVWKWRPISLANNSSTDKTPGGAA